MNNQKKGINSFNIMCKNRKKKNDDYYAFKYNRTELICHPKMYSPVPRSGHRIVHSLDNEYIYLYGGFNDSRTLNHYRAFNENWVNTKPLFQELWRYHKLTKTWQWIRTEGESPPEVASHCMAMLDEKRLLVYGGSKFPFGRISSNRIYLCNLQTKTWSQVEYDSNSEVPLPRYGQGIVLDRTNGYLYVCGGTDGLLFSFELHRFSFETKKWERLSDDSEEMGPRYRHEIALWKDAIYVVGGGTIAGAFSNIVIPVFDLNKRIWTMKKAKPFVNGKGEKCYPHSRYSHEGGQLNGRMYICGGTDKVNAYKDIWYLDLDTLTWYQELAKLPHSTYFHSSSISKDGELIVFGGVTNVKTKRRTNALYSIWLSVPSLCRMSFEATLLQIRKEVKQNQCHDFDNIEAKYIFLKTQQIKDYFINAKAFTILYSLMPNKFSLNSNYNKRKLIEQMDNDHEPTKRLLQQRQHQQQHQQLQKPNENI